MENMRSFNNDRQPKLKPIDTLALMAKTSLTLTQELDNIYHHNVADSQKIGGVVLGVFGSGERNEMLPYSDVDTAIFTSDNKTIDSLSADIRALPYDKIDIPIAENFNVSKLLRFAEENSPDSHSLHLKIIGAEAPAETLDGLGRIKETLTSRKSYLENLVFDYHYLKYRAGKKGNEKTPNLKYSNGGPRDMLYLDWAASYFTNNGTNKKADMNKIPRIKYSIDELSDEVPEVAAEELLWSINTVNTVKHHALEILHQGGKFDGVLSDLTCKDLLNNYDYGGVRDVGELKNQYSLARSAIRFTKDAVYNKVLKELSDDEFGSDFSNRMRDIDMIWTHKSELDSSSRSRELIMDRLMCDGRWSSVATVVAQDDANEKQIDMAVDLASETPSFSHIFRIVAKHPNVSRNTLQRLLRFNEIALDDDVNSRYRKIIQERLASNAE